MRRLAYGPAAWLLDGVDDPAALGRAIAGAGIDGIDDVVPAESTVLVRCAAATAPLVGSHLDSIVPLPVDAAVQDPVIIDVVYDGLDLADVARSAHLGVEEVIERHLAAEYTVAFCGFSPGFGYLRGLDPVLHIDRRATPRTRVPGGSVAIAAGYSAVYPSASPGGWHLLGTTTTTLWDDRADPPASMLPGRLVRFRRVDP
jgi:KipI family sensor histidine kinase inhibitor